MSTLERGKGVLQGLHAAQADLRADTNFGPAALPKFRDGAGLTVYAGVAHVWALELLPAAIALLAALASLRGRPVRARQRRGLRATRVDGAFRGVGHAHRDGFARTARRAGGPDELAVLVRGAARVGARVRDAPVGVERVAIAPRGRGATGDEQGREHRAGGQCGEEQAWELVCGHGVLGESESERQLGTP